MAHTYSEDEPSKTAPDQQDLTRATDAAVTGAHNVNSNRLQSPPIDTCSSPSCQSSSAEDAISVSEEPQAARRRIDFDGGFPKRFAPHEPSRRVSHKRRKGKVCQDENSSSAPGCFGDQDSRTSKVIDLTEKDSGDISFEGSAKTNATLSSLPSRGSSGSIGHGDKVPVSQVNIRRDDINDRAARIAHEISGVSGQLGIHLEPGFTDKGFAPIPRQLEVPAADTGPNSGQAPPQPTDNDHISHDNAVVVPSPAFSASVSPIGTRDDPATPSVFQQGLDITPSQQPSSSSVSSGNKRSRTLGPRQAICSRGSGLSRGDSRGSSGQPKIENFAGSTGPAQS